MFSDLPEGDYVVTAKNGNLEGSKDVDLDHSQSVTVTIKEGGNGPVDGELDWLLIGGVIGAIAIILVGVYVYYKEKKVKR